MPFAPQTLCAAVASLAFIAGPLATHAVAAEGRVLLTVAGEVAAPNRGPSHADDATMFGAFDLEFDAATTFDAEALAALDQGAFPKSLHDGAHEGTFTGPRLSAILEAVGQPGAAALPFALDGYQQEISPELIAEYDPIVATHFDGAPLGIGELGPLAVIFPDVEDAETDDMIRSLQVWAMFFMQVE